MERPWLQDVSSVRPELEEKGDRIAFACDLEVEFRVVVQGPPMAFAYLARLAGGPLAPLGRPVPEGPPDPTAEDSKVTFVTLTADCRTDYSDLHLRDVTEARPEQVVRRRRL